MSDKTQNHYGRQSDTSASYRSSHVGNRAYTPRQKKNFLDSLHNWLKDKKYSTVGQMSSMRYVGGSLRNTIIYSFLVILGLYLIWVFGAVYTQLPVLTPEGISHSQFSQSTAVTDKNGKVLYKFYEENRQYVDYDKISEQAINAFVAIEDKSFWTNDGVDVFGIIRAFFNTMRNTIGLGGRSGGASTITQQLLKNILGLDKDEAGFYDKVVRKHKERLLVGKLSSVVESDIKQKYPNLSSDELDRKKKEKVMELYLNFIYLGNQNYGIEASAQSYFGKSSKDLSIVEGAILASMPQSPSRYNPYKYPTRVLGTLHIRDAQGNDILSGDVVDAVINEVVKSFMNNTTPIQKGNDMFQKYTTSIVPSTLTLNGMIYQLSYDVGRKDAVLNRMYEDGYITQDQLKRAFADGLMLKLKSAVIDIKAPHFVFFIRDLLIKGDTRFKDLGITEDMLYQGGIQIKTTLDLDIQEVAEKAVSDNMPILYDRGGNNRSLLHIDTTNGDVLAYVGSAGYNNTKIQGQNDMVRNARQPGSSVKPLIYAYALQTLPITIDTPIYDIPLTVGTLTPNNADGKFEGLLPLRQALAHSRNIPAVKAYFAAGKEPELKPFLQGLGLKSLKNNNSYGYSLALGAGEVPMLEMAQAYSFLSQKGEGYDINPILEIRGADGELLYKKEPKKIVSGLKSGVAYLMWKILSETANMPSGWIRYYAINGLKYAVKSGTSNKVIKVNGEDKSVPRDGWLATYTPSRVTMYWAGNADDTPMNKNALGLLLNSEVNKSFYSQMLSKGYIKNEDMSPVDVASLSISKVTGKIATASTPEQFVIKTLAFNSAIGLDGPYIPVTIDTSCGKKASPLTPSEQRINAFVFTPTSIASIDLVDINLWYNNRLKSFNSTGDNTSFEDIVLITKEPDGVCDGRDVQLSDDITLTTSLVADQIVPNKFSFSFTAQSSLPIKKVTVLLNDAIIGSFAYNTTTVSDTKTVRLRNIIGTGKQNLEIIAFNEDNKAQLVSLPVTVGGEDGKVFSLPTVPVSSSGELVGTGE